MSNNQEQVKTETASAATEQRIITVVSTRGENKKIPFDGNKWADLKTVLQNEGYELNNMKCVESIKKTTLEHPEAIVPDGNFRLFMMPMESKSGVELKRKEAYDFIKAAIEKDGDKAINHFNAGKNYTNQPTSSLNELIEAYKPGNKKKVSKAKAEAISDVIEAVKSSKTSGEISHHLEGLSHDEKLNIVIQILAGLLNSSPVATATAQAAPAKTAAQIQAEKDEEERQQKEKEEKEQERLRKEKEKEQKEQERQELAQEMETLQKGFSDVKRRR